MAKYFFIFQKAGLDVNGNSMIKVQGYRCKCGNQYTPIDLDLLNAMCVGIKMNKRTQTVTTQLNVDMLLVRCHQFTDGDYYYTISGE